MKNWIKIIVLFVLLGGLAIVFLQKKTIDIRNDYLKNQLSSADYPKGKYLISKMQEAYGGIKIWESFDKAIFKQQADWYGKKLVSGWGADPMQFIMTSQLGTDDSEMLLLIGEHKGKIWGVEEGQLYTIKNHQTKERVLGENAELKRKLLFKNYWFQFPFRIHEASIIAYAGTDQIDGKTYDLIYATWGSEFANPDFDQFILYLDQETYRIEYLHFTVRDMVKLIELTTKFDDFKSVGQLTLPHAQYVRFGKPSKNGTKMHENIYFDIRMAMD